MSTRKTKEPIVYDYALPQQWVEDCKMLFPLVDSDLWVSSFVWSYDINRLFGSPYPLTKKAKKLLSQYDEKKGTHYVNP